jgi:glycosyltransferase involved in cell wall biosynthesis
VDTDVYYPTTGRTCTFLCVHSNLGSPSSREYWSDTLVAYLAAFAHTDDVRLVIKTWGWKPPLWEAAVNEAVLGLGLEPGRAPAVDVIGDRLSGEEMRDLYHRSWLFIKNADREGWSLPCTEAMACGRPIAATRIEPLVSLLPDDTMWFDSRDIDGLKGILEREYARFQEFRRSWERFPANAMGHRVGTVLERLVSQSRGTPTASEAPR